MFVVVFQQVCTEAEEGEGLGTSLRGLRRERVWVHISGG